MNVRRKGSRRSLKSLLLAIAVSFPWLAGCTPDAFVTGASPLLGGLYSFDLITTSWRFAAGNLWLQIIQLF